jgi:DNA-binding LytR/AlgR family response regulator
MVLIGAGSGEGFAQFSVLPFQHGAVRWQLFQGVVLYALVAVTAFAEQLAGDMHRTPEAAPGGAGTPVPLFIKQDDDLVPIDPDRIILVRGADDYSEIVTEASTHLVRQRLGSVAERLGERFVRVHRSYVVNASRIARAEPTGNGTLQLIMSNGAAVKTSRAGTRLLRQLLI